MDKLSKPVHKTSPPARQAGMGTVSIKGVDIIQHILAGALEGTRCLHFQGDQGRAVLQGLGNAGALAFRDVAGEGGIPPAGAAGQVPGLDGSGVDSLAVIGQDLGVVGDEDLLGPPLVQQAGSLRPVGEAR